MSDEVQLARELLRAPSPSGHEGPAAEVLHRALSQLGYEAHVDAVGNVVGTLRLGDGPSLMLNGHLDTVPVGDEALWPHPPLSGVVADGRLWGRGACDMKAALACMAFAGRDARDAGFHGTLIVSGVVQEEVGGLGARALAAREAHVDLVLLGEPSRLRLMLGHRGRVELTVQLPGRMAHAARADLGQNALYRAAAFLRRLEALELPRGGPLGGSSLTPTGLSSFPPEGKNVVPGRADLTIDYRNLPDDEPEQIRARLQGLDPEARITVASVVAPYLAPRDHPLVDRVSEALRPVLERAGRSRFRVSRAPLRTPGEAPPLRALEQGHWWFCTDAPELAAMADVVLGFGPGEEELAHTTRECVTLEELHLARLGYAAVALGL